MLGESHGQILWLCEILLITLPAVLNPQWGSRNKGGTFKPHCSAASIYSLFQPKAGHAKELQLSSSACTK